MEQGARIRVAVLAGLLVAACAGEEVTPALENAVPAEATGVRLKDLVSVAGVRDNQLHGIGVVVGLSATGDKNAGTVRMLRQLLASKFLSFGEKDLASKNAAMVVVTADLPAFARNGTRLPVQVACIGDGSSLRGGVLLETRMVAADGRIYAVAQGPVSVGGYGKAGPALGTAGKDHENIETVAQLVEGAIVEREVPTTLLYGDRLRLILNDPDFTTANTIARALAAEFSPEQVEAMDAATVTLRFGDKPTDSQLVEAIARLECLRVQPDVRARVVINVRTGTIVVGQNVRVGRAAVSHGGLSLQVVPAVRTVTDPANPNATRQQRVWMNQITGQVSDKPPAGTVASEMPGSLNVMEGARVEDIATGLNALGARPRDLVAIFQALHRAGALHAELVVM